jgi:hypothetical protein
MMHVSAMSAGEQVGIRAPSAHLHAAWSWLATHTSDSKHHDCDRTGLHNQIVHGGNSVFILACAAVTVMQTV